jgi:DNA-binding IclR family transcriptional regulator
MKEEAVSKTGIINSLVRGLEVLEIVANQEDGANAKLVSKLAKLNLSTTYHLLNTLVSAGYLIKQEESQKFYLSYKVSYLSDLLYKHHNSLPVLIPFVQALSSETKETVGLGLRQGNEVVLAHKVEGKQAVMVNMVYVGYTEHCYARALGKAVLAYFTLDELEEHLKLHPIVPLTPKTAKNQAELEQHLAQIRRYGIVYDEEEFREGVSAIAAPIFDYRGQVVASLSVALPAFRYGVRREEIARLVHNKALAASRALGFEPGSQTNIEKAG